MNSAAYFLASFATSVIAEMFHLPASVKPGAIFSMRTLVLLIALVWPAFAAATELHYNTVVRIASAGEEVDFADFRYVRPILQLSHRGARSLPPEASVRIGAGPGAITLYPDPLGAIEWPIRRDLIIGNPPVTSVPNDLVAAGRIRVAATPAISLEPATIAEMVVEYERFTSGLAFMKRIAAPDAEDLLVIASGPITATSTAGRWEASDGRLRIPLRDATRAPLRFSAVPILVLLDLELE